MAIRHKRKSTSGYVWDTSDLVDGQLGLNTADGTLHLLKTDASIQTIGLPSGATSQIQYNSSGVFGASANLTWDNTTFTLGLSGTTTSTITSNKALALTAGSSAVAAGSSITLTTGSSTMTGTGTNARGGVLNLRGGTGLTGRGGGFSFIGGDCLATTGTQLGGGITFGAGAGPKGGATTLYSGNGNVSNGGNINILCGGGTTTGGSVIISAGGGLAESGGAATGGNLYLRAGTSDLASTSDGGFISFSTADTDTLAERMRLDKDGTLIIYDGGGGAGLALNGQGPGFGDGPCGGYLASFSEAGDFVGVGIQGGNTSLNFGGSIDLTNPTNVQGAGFYAGSGTTDQAQAQLGLNRNTGAQMLLLDAGDTTTVGGNIQLWDAAAVRKVNLVARDGYGSLEFDNSKLTIDGTVVSQGKLNFSLDSGTSVGISSAPFTSGDQCFINIQPAAGTTTPGQVNIFAPGDNGTVLNISNFGAGNPGICQLGSGDATNAPYLFLLGPYSNSGYTLSTGVATSGDDNCSLSLVSYADTPADNIGLVITPRGEGVINVNGNANIGSTAGSVGFFNTTPVVQQAAIADATNPTSVITQCNLILAVLRAYGLIAT